MCLCAHGCHVCVCVWGGGRGVEYTGHPDTFLSQCIFSLLACDTIVIDVQVPVFQKSLLPPFSG
jgi:hypothetical protein